VNRAERIETQMVEHLDVQHIEALDESHNHSVPEGAESHFKLVAVCAEFDGLSRIARHRLVNDLMTAEFEGGMHALALHLYTADQWAQRFGDVPMSPSCLGGSKADSAASSTT